MKKQGENRLGGELEQSWIRFWFSIVVYTYVCLVYWFSTGGIPAGFHIFFIVYFSLAVILLLAARMQLGPVLPRRVIAFIADPAATTSLLIIGGHYAEPIWGIYLWTVVGYGFRFGSVALFISLLLAVIGYSIVLLFSPHWHVDTYFSIGLMITLIIVPLYVFVIIRRLEKARETAEMALDVKNRFITKMSHELLTPLNGIIGHSELLQQEVREQGQMKMYNDLRNIQYSGEHLLMLINDVLDLAKLNDQHISLEPIPFSLFTLLDEITSEIDVRARINDNQFAVLSQYKGDTVFQDRTRLKQVVMNLLDNACKFTHSGKVSLKVEGSEGEYIRFTIIDTGIGMYDEEIDELFEPFRQGRDSSDVLGAGLGLAVCKQFVDLMQGELHINSEPGQGSSVSVYFCMDNF